MSVSLLARLPVAGLGLALTAPSKMLRAAGTVAGGASELAALGVRGAVEGTSVLAETAVGAGRVARNALAVGGEHWRAGSRLHLRVRSRLSGKGDLGRAARSVALALADHPDVLFAYWDDGLQRLVVQLTDDAVTAQVSRVAGRLAVKYGLAHAGDEDADELAPADGVNDVRTAATALTVDTVGAAAAVAGRMLRLRRSPELIQAASTLAKEDPRVRALLQRRLGRQGADLTLAAVNAVAHGVGCSPTPLVLDAALRASQLAEAVARSAAHDEANDMLCAPERVAVAGDRPTGRPRREHPGDSYAASATTGSLLAAAVPLLVRGDVRGAAATVLAGAPKAAGHGPAAFTAGIGVTLARAGVLVREVDRLRLLERVDTVVLHPSALRDPDGELDPLADTVLDAARRADLTVVLVDDPALGEFAALADEVTDPREPLSGLVGRLQEDGRVVLTVARPPCRHLGHSADCADAEARALLGGLLRGDLAVSVADDHGAVVWSADVLSRPGLAGLWRLLVAVPHARRVGRQARIMAQAGTVLSGLLLVARRRLPVSPVDLASAGALATGWGAALRVATTAAPTPRPRVAWHALDPEQAQSRLAGLSPTEPPTALARLGDRARRLAEAGVAHPAMTPPRLSMRLAKTTAAELADPLTPILAVGAAASAILGSPVDALLVAGAMGLNAVGGGIQRLRAEQALSALARGQRQLARRVTDGTDATALIPADKLVPGDVIVLEVGDVVPADARLLELTDLEVDESALTGESLPTQKRLDATPEAPVNERRCMVYEGTTVVAGQATALVVGTGERTEAGRAVSLASRSPAPPGLQARLGELTRWALPLTLAGGAAVTGLSLLRGQPLREAVKGGVAVAVAAVPEGLPLVATVAQLAAARRLGRRGVLVRAPRALEALGRVDTVCFDKTGTLTENKLRVVRVALPGGAKHGPDEPGAEDVLRTAARACPRGEDDNGEAAHAHATDEAILACVPSDQGWSQLDGLPFEAARGYAAAIGTDADGTRQLVVKGAPEAVLHRCTVGGAGQEAAEEELAGKGLRVLAIARLRLGDDQSPDLADEALAGLELLGLVGIADRPRRTSRELVEGLRAAGVRPVMLTGDHPVTAHAIATDLGWPEETSVVTGDQLAALDGAGRARALRDADVVARVAPEQKLQVIEALRAADRVLAMVGDGANDAAAIRAADVGVGIAARGSAAARNAADLIHTNGDLGVLVDAVAEGRALWRSAADAVGILVGGNAGEVGFSVLGALASGRSPLGTRQLLLVNLLTDMFPAMAVAVTPSEADDADAADAPTGVGLLGAPLASQIRRRGVITGIGAGTAWLVGTLTPGSARRTSTMALCGLVGAQLTQTLVGRERSPLVLATTAGSALALTAIVQTPGVSHFFGCTPLGPVAWAGVGAAVGAAAVSGRISAGAGGR